MKNIHLNNVIIAFIYNYVMDISTPKLFVHVPKNNLHFQWKIVMYFTVCFMWEVVVYFVDIGAIINAFM